MIFKLFTNVELRSSVCDFYETICGTNLQDDAPCKKNMQFTKNIVVNSDRKIYSRYYKLRFYTKH
jgi:hypothetical protein